MTTAADGVAEGLEADDDSLEPTAAGDDVEHRESVVAATQHGVRMDLALVALAGEFSRSHLQGLVAAGHVRLDGCVIASASRKVRAGQRLAVDLVPTAESRAFRAEPMPLVIVFEDEHLLVVDKPAGLVVHPAAGHWGGTLLNGLLAHHAAAATLPRAGIVHRLDKDTSGLMVVGKTLAAVTALVRRIAARDVHRQYLALAHGAVQPPRLTVAEPIARDPRSRVRMGVVAGGKPARTDVECLAFGNGISALRCTLHTGRTHQIRVHLSCIGHPLIADALYGGVPSEGLQRQALHATRLAFDHPTLLTPMQFEAPLPPDMAAAWANVMAGGHGIA